MYEISGWGVYPGESSWSWNPENQSLASCSQTPKRQFLSPESKEYNFPRFTREHFCLYSLFFSDINMILTKNCNHQCSDSSLWAIVDCLGG